MSITIQEICDQIPVLNDAGAFAQSQSKARGESVESVAHGLAARKPPVRVTNDEVKAIWIKPEEALSILVATVSVNGRVIGYQREFVRQHARKIALELQAGTAFPAVDLAQDGNGAIWAVDGQHRLAASVIARRSVLAVVRKLSKEDQRKLFGGQRKAKAVDRNVLILAGASPYERYIQDAVASDNHPWGRIVSANPSSITRISPNQMLSLLANYVGNAASHHMSDAMVERWEEELADDLAPKIACFGNKKDNPAAFRATAIRAIGETAMHVFRRNEALQLSDHRRWISHMPGFDFNGHLWVRKQSQMTVHLIAHWNKRLHEARKVSL